MNMIVDYNRLLGDVKHFSKFTQTGVIGKSESGRDIPYVFWGREDAPQVIICGSVHAREYITTSLINLIINQLVYGAEISLGVWFVPMVNPDGVELCLYGLESVASGEKKKFLVDINGGSADFSLYKANINGVDLNNNFPARFGQDPRLKKSPAPSGYPGAVPANQSETKALMALTEYVKPTSVVAYHTKGEVIYWDFYLEGTERARHLQKAEILSQSLGYYLVGNDGSTGGYKDWVIEKFNQFGYTIEVGDDGLAHPIGEEGLANIYYRNRNIIKILEEMFAKQ